MARLMRYLPVLLLAAVLPIAAAAQSAGDTAMTRLLAQAGAQPCEEAPGFQCVSLTVPLDHTDPANAGTLDVVFAVRPADDPVARRGMFVTVTGGPGYSGLHAAEGYTSFMDARVLEHFDIVFFDQRAIGRSQGVRCDEAALAYYQATSPDPEEQIDAAQQFAGACLAEIDDPAILPFAGTTQAVHDLEAFREAVGDFRLWLYGESYGTQFAQTYAAAYPQHVAGLILDGVVDLTRTAEEYYVGQDQAFDAALQAAFSACSAEAACLADFPPGGPQAAYDALLAQLEQGPLPAEVLLPDGTRETRMLTYAMLDAVVIDAAYTEWGRAEVLRELAAAARGQLLPLLRHAYSYLGMDPLTGQPAPDPGWSDASYYAIECSDYQYTLALRDPVCVFWQPARPPAERPAPFSAPVRTLLLNATLDPATPIDNAQAVAARLPQAWSITMQGGPHVIYGRGGSCPDDQVTAFLVSDRAPAERESSCDGVAVSAYEPLPTAPDDPYFTDPAWE